MKKIIAGFLFVAMLILGTNIKADAKSASVYRRAITRDKKIAFTFDDGPHPRYTDEILTVLQNEGVRATFFQIGENVAMYPDITKRIIAAGHEIGNHTYTHPFVGKSTLEQLEEEIIKTDKVLSDLGARTPRLFRPPQGICPKDFDVLLQKTGKIAILWNVDTKDWDNRTTDEIVCSVHSNVRGGDIVLFHDYVGKKSHTVAAIKKLIPALKKDGYQFVTVSELLSEDYAQVT